MGKLVFGYVLSLLFSGNGTIELIQLKMWVTLIQINSGDGACAFPRV
jgi:hypothetical protein